MVARFDVYLARLDATEGSEVAESCPCVVISPDVLNQHLRTVIVALMTRRVRGYPNRVQIVFRGTEGEIATDQIRALDRSRLGPRIGHITDSSARTLCRQIEEMFAYE